MSGTENAVARRGGQAHPGRGETASPSADGRPQEAT
jgi:hypothetical protein